MPKTKVPELPQIEQLPDSMIWFQGQQINTAEPLAFTVGGEDVSGMFADVKDQYAEHLRETAAAWQASHGFARKSETLAKASKKLIEVSEPKPIVFTAPKVMPKRKAVEIEPVVAARPIYREPSVKQKVAEFMSDLPWKDFDRRYGTSIADERKARRVAQRILVARMAAGVDELPVWGKYKKALAEAEKLV